MHVRLGPQLIFCLGLALMFAQSAAAAQPLEEAPVGIDEHTSAPAPGPSPAPAPAPGPSPAPAPAPVSSTPGGIGVSPVVQIPGSSSQQPAQPAAGGGEQHDGGSDGGEIEWVASAISELIGPAIDADPICIGVANNPNCYVIPELTSDDIDIAGVPEGQVSGPPADPAPAEAPYVPSQAEIQATILAAYDAVTYPDLTLHTAPPGDLDAPLITQLATFLWVDPAQWQPISASASIPGHLTVTATARRQRCGGPAPKPAPSSATHPASPGIRAHPKSAR